MLCIFDTTTNPYYNLAAEEYLLKNFDVPIFRLWRNEPAVIVGCNQNTLAEINRAFILQNNISVVRRLSGGGAVFHDLGNVNYTFIEEKKPHENTGDLFKRFTQPIIQALRSLGVDAQLEGRNDLSIDGKKFSGNAIHIDKNRILHHGTLLFSASIKNLSKALQARSEKFIGKSVKSTKSRVTNISEHLKNLMPVEEFISYLEQYILATMDNFTRYEYTENDIKAIIQLKTTKYATDEWNYGKSPLYTYTKISHTVGGIVEVYLNVVKGIIQNVKIFGDFFGMNNISDIEKKLKNCDYKHEAIAARLQDININEYISNMDKNTFIDVFFES